MDHTSPMSVPGFGWATAKGKDLVVLDGGGRAVTLDDIAAGFPTKFPEAFVRKFCEENGILIYDIPNFSIAINEVLESYFVATPFEDEYKQFIRTGRSNDRLMKWDIMSIQPNTSFRLHAHPNIELIYVIKGAMHEMRHQGPQHKEYTSSTDTVGPDLSKGVNGTFSHRCTRATDATEAEADATDKCLYKSSFLVNEKGSVHLSFTQEDGAILLILWSGCHANVPKEFNPPKGTIPDLPVGVEPLHKEGEEGGI